MYLYVIKNKVSGSEYCGITKSIKARWASHKWAAKNNKKTALYDAIRKYGIDFFELAILEYSEDTNYICSREIDLIASGKYKYNLHKGGHIGFDVRTKGPKETAEWKTKLSKARQGRKPALGMKHTEDTKKLCGVYGKLRWDKYGRYPKEVLDYGFTEANKRFGISKTHYYRLRKTIAV
jgi:group I intron endonuclease